MSRNSDTPNKLLWRGWDVMSVTMFDLAKKDLKSATVLFNYNDNLCYQCAHLTCKALEKALRYYYFTHDISCLETDSVVKLIDGLDNKISNDVDSILRAIRPAAVDLVSWEVHYQSAASYKVPVVDVYMALSLVEEFIEYLDAVVRPSNEVDSCWSKCSNC